MSRGPRCRYNDRRLVPELRPRESRMAKDRLNQLTLGYSEAQDRIWIADPDQPDRLWMTYRITRRLLKGATVILEQTRENLNVPWSPEKDEQLKLEKQEAASPDWLDQGGDEGRKLRAEANAILVTGIEIKPERKRFRLTFRAGKVEQHTLLDRMEFHRFSRSLFQMCNVAEWQMEDLPDWFRDDADLS